MLVAIIPGKGELLPPATSYKLEEEESNPSGYVSDYMLKDSFALLLDSSLRKAREAVLGCSSRQGI